MPQKSETRAVEARASRNSCGGCFRDLLSPRTLRSQFPITLPRFQPVTGTMIAALERKAGST